MRGPPVSHRFPRRALLTARCRDRARLSRQPPPPDRAANRFASHAAVYPVRRAGEYAAPPCSRGISVVLTSPPSSLVGHRRTAVPPARRHLHPRVRPRRRPCAGEAPPCFPRPPRCADEVAAATHACRATTPSCALVSVELGQAVGRAHCAGRGRAGPGWAARALRRPAAPALCHWAARGFGPVAFDLYFYIF
jgi:hypothetical protein